MVSGEFDAHGWSRDVPTTMHAVADVPALEQVQRDFSAPTPGHLCADVGGLSVSGRGARCVQSSHRRLGTYRTGPRSSRHGARLAPIRHRYLQAAGWQDQEVLQDKATIAAGRSG